MKLTIFISLVVILCACSGNKTSFSSMKEFEAYVNDPDNGFISSDGNSDFMLEAKLIPAIADDKEKQFTIQVRLSRKDGGSVLDYGGVSKEVALQREGYFSFEALGDVYLEDEDKLHPAIFHHYERNYGLKPSIDLFFRFNYFEPKENVTFVFRDQQFDQGMFRIEFNKALFTSCHVQE